MAQKVAVRVNTTQFIQKLGNAFASHLSVVRELIQNARRAGSPVVRIFWDEAHATLTVEDDGKGISNFQDLLSVAESGWDGSLQEEEKPWGTGFMSALYAAKEISVESNGEKLHTRTADLLNFNTIETVPCAHYHGTRVTLVGISIEKFESKIREMVEGYPIPVFFNGTELPRPHAAGTQIDGARWVETSVGRVAMHGLDDPRKYDDNAIFYLQGFRVYSTRQRWYNTGNIVHLDSRRFTAVYPDRDRLRDQEEMAKQYHAMINAFFRLHVDHAKANMAPAAFVEKYWQLIRSLGYAEVINDLDVLPADVFNQVTSYPYDAGDTGEDFVSCVKETMSRQRLEETVVLSLPNFWVDQDDTKMIWMLAYRKNWLLVDSGKLHKDHWLFKMKNVHLFDDEDLEDLDLQIEVHVEKANGYVSGQWLYTDITLCESYTIKSTLGEFTFTDDAIGLESHGIVYPDGERSGMVARHLCNFHDDNYFMSDICDADEDAVSSLAQQLRITEPDGQLAAILNETKLRSFDSVHGKAFVVIPGKERHSVRFALELGELELPDSVFSSITDSVKHIIDQHRAGLVAAY